MNAGVKILKMKVSLEDTRGDQSKRSRDHNSRILSQAPSVILLARAKLGRKYPIISENDGNRQNSTIAESGPLRKNLQ
jgi:hypothetical protein